jgi:hypothetical protein
MLQTAANVPEPVIRDAVARAFRGQAGTSVSVWSRFLQWVYVQWLRFWHWLGLGQRSLDASRPVKVLVLAIVLAVVLAVVARTIWVWRARGGVERPGALGGGRFLRGTDPWAEAQALAAAGDHTAAAHALYATLLEYAARAQQVRLHPSKTLGDYARELRSRGSRLAPGFRAFAGDYESVIYGDQRCDAERYGRLFALASPMFRADG